MKKLNLRAPLGTTDLTIPPIVFGTSYLGNLYTALSWERKLQIMQGWFDNVASPVVIDTAGKYGAGLALEAIGKGLTELRIDPDDILISNKLGWIRTPLTGPEPTFEKGVWADIKHDATHNFGYKGILECWEQGLELLGGNYNTPILSVHDPDEFVVTATNAKERAEKMDAVMESYHALLELKQQGKADAIGIGSKDWRIIREITNQIDLDWVMLAVSFTIMDHPSELIEWIEDLARKNVSVINSAVFHGGFLTGGDYYNYRIADRNSVSDKPLFAWRDRFFKICAEHKVKPSDACIKFGVSHQAIISIALNTSRPEKVPGNIALIEKKIPDEFYRDMKDAGLIDPEYQYV